jgi:hypothetical protein
MQTKQTQFLKDSNSHSTTAATLGVLLWLWLTLLPVHQAGGQGQVSFNTRIPGGAGVGLTLHIWGPSATNPSLALVGLGSNDNPSGTTSFGSASGMSLIGANGSGGQYGYATTFAQLIGAVGASQPESALVPVGQTTTFHSGGGLGLLAGITVTLTNNPGGSIIIPTDAPAATFEIVAWDNSSTLYPTWAQASAAWQQGLIAAGRSSPFTVTNIGGLTNSPPFLNNLQGSANGMMSFNLYSIGISPPASNVVTLPATNVTASTATLNGTVNPSGYPTTAWFQWGTTTNYGNLTAVTNMGSGTAPVPLAASILVPCPYSLYHFRVVATNSAGLVYGNDQSFMTSWSRPFVTTSSATDVTATSATLNGTVNPNGVDTYAAWEYGPTTNYGSFTPWASVGSGWAATNMTPYYLAVPIPGTTIHFRAVASNPGGPFRANDLSFTTSPPLTINCGSDDWKTGCTNLCYRDGADPGRHFILLQSADPTAPLSAWTRVATNASTPGSFPIPPVGTAGPAFYRVKSE